MGSFVKTINSSNINLGNGLISSTNIFQPVNYNSTVTASNYNQPFYFVSNATSIVRPNIIYPVVTPGQYRYTTGTFNVYDPSEVIVFKLNNLPLFVTGNGERVNTSNFVTTNKDLYFLEKTIIIPSRPTSKLRMYLNFNTASTTSSSYILRNDLYSFDSFDGRMTKSNQPGIYSLSANTTPSKIGFRILANNVVIYDLKNNFTGNIEVTIPSGTTSIKFETYDEAFPNGAPLYYFRNTNYYVAYNNLRIVIDNLPSIPINNSTNSNSSYSYLEPIRSSSLSVSDLDTNGYHDIVLGQFEKDAPVDYFVVGDDWKDPNFRPLNVNRNICLEFDNIDYSDIDEDERIELVLDVIDIDTSEAEEQYDHLDLPKPIVKEFYKNGDDALDSPPNNRRARINCSVSRGDFVNTISGISSGPSTFTSAPKVPIKGGLLIYDITQGVKESILASRQKIVVWLTYDEGTRDKYVTFKIGNKEINKPRIRFKLK